MKGNRISVKNFDVNEEFFNRIDNRHILDTYIGRDLMGRLTLLYILDTKPSKVSSSNIIEVEVGERYDNRWAMSFFLKDIAYEELFVYFCNDMIESSRQLFTSDKGSTFVCNRYTMWQKMLDKTNGGLLSSEVVKGLIGELLFLHEYMIKMYGVNNAVRAWCGPHGQIHDFEVEDNWYEIKALSRNSTTVKISSIEQLDTIKCGELVLFFFESTSSIDKRGYNLNQLVRSILDLLDDLDSIDYFKQTLMSIGYFETSQYDNQCYKEIKVEFYKVNNDFPCIRRNVIPTAVVNSNYELAIAGIRKFIKE